jgi:hypothetical protein
VGTPTILRPAFSTSAFLATTAIAPFTQFKDDLQGEFIIQPGTVLVLQGVAAAGTSPLVIFSVTWEEVTIV